VVAEDLSLHFLMTGLHATRVVIGVGILAVIA
jgi:heme/copper-type cytochrome/quinol oxidase subunit 3